MFSSHNSNKVFIFIFYLLMFPQSVVLEQSHWLSKNQGVYIGIGVTAIVLLLICLTVIIAKSKSLRNCAYRCILETKCLLPYIPCVFFFLVFFCVFFFAFQGYARSIRKFPGQGSNQSYSYWPTPQPQQCRIGAASATYTTAHSSTEWARQGIEPESSCILVRLVTTEP